MIKYFYGKINKIFYTYYTYKLIEKKNVHIILYKFFYFIKKCINIQNLLIKIIYSFTSIKLILKLCSSLNYNLFSIVDFFFN